MDDSKTVWIGNLPDETTEELLYELFLQAGPIQTVRIPNLDKGRKAQFGFVEYKHEESVLYSVRLFEGVKLFNKCLHIKPRNPGGQQRNSHDNVPLQRSVSYPNEHHVQQFNDSNMGHHMSAEDVHQMAVNDSIDERQRYRHHNRHGNRDFRSRNDFDRDRRTDFNQRHRGNRDRKDGKRNQNARY